MLSSMFPSSPLGWRRFAGEENPSFSAAVERGILQYRLYYQYSHIMFTYANSTPEVDRAIDNLVKSGKLFGMPTRRDSMPLVGAPRPYSDYGKQSVKFRAKTSLTP